MGQNKVATQDLRRMVAHYYYLRFCSKQIRTVSRDSCASQSIRHNSTHLDAVADRVQEVL